jgi:hypothetical protein
LRGGLAVGSAAVRASIGRRSGAVRQHGADVDVGVSSPARSVPAGLAHVATVSFLASRVSPSGQFWLAIAGGIALARAASTAGLRTGYGVGIAAMLQTTALMGPARFTGPLTQALTAPLIGWLHQRGAPLALQLLACFGIRLAHYLVLAVAFIWIILGGVDAFTGTYDAVAGWLGFLPQGREAALAATVLIYGVTAVFYSAIQVVVYRRALNGWPAHAQPLEHDDVAAAPAVAPGFFDARAVAVAAGIAFVLLLTPPSWALLAAVALWLALATVTSRPDPHPLRLGLALTALLAATSFGAAWLADLGTDEAARRATRAALLVLVATWLRAAAGADGLREVFTRALRRLRAIPAIREAAVALDGLDPRGSVTAAGRALVARLSAVPATPLAITDAVVDWVASETAGFRPDRIPAVPHATLRLAARDAALTGLAAAPALTLLLA